MWSSTVQNDSLEKKGKVVQQLQSLWSALDTSKRMVVLGAAITVFIGVLALTRMAATPTMALLYSGLSPSAAGDVVAALEGQSVPYQIEGNTILVPEALRDQLRLTLASSGLPANSGEGYELLDGLSGFGTTSQMFDAAYMRAKEGELARTIIATPSISAARVHIAKGTGNPFRDQTLPTASVSIRGDGSQISDSTAEAIRFLVASAVAGLQAENVSIIDADRGVVMGNQVDPTPARSAMEHGERLKLNVERLMQALTGIGGAVVEVNVETLTDEEMIVERTIDPDGRVAISTNTQEITRSSNSSDGAGVSVASNLPEGEGAGGGQESSQNSELQETINYEVSETTREVRRIAGSIKRVSVAVLVDGARRVDDSGTEVWEPRGAEEMAQLEQLVKSAVGFDESRGDTVTIQSMDLQPDPALVETPENGWVNSQPLDIMALAKLGVTAAVVLALGFFVIRPILMGARNGQGELNTLEDAPALPGAGASALDGEIADDFMGDFGGMGGGPMMGSALDSFSMDGDGGGDDPVDRLKNLIESRQEETVEVLKSWVESPETSTS